MTTALNLPSPYEIGILTLLPQRAAVLSTQALVRLSHCLDEGWADVKKGIYSRTPVGDAAISQACREPIR